MNITSSSTDYSPLIALSVRGDWSLSDDGLITEFFKRLWIQQNQSVTLSGEVQVSPRIEISFTQQIKNQEASKLIRSWLADESGFDELIWPKAKKTIEENNLSTRVRFNE
jgi:hypothetical protein